MKLKHLFKPKYILIVVIVLCLLCLLFQCYKFFSLKAEKFNQCSFNNFKKNNVKEEFEITDKSDNSSQNNKGEIILYYASWCGYSRMFLPEWEKFEKYVKGNLPLRIRKIRCESENEVLCLEKDIPGYPTVILYPKNETEIVFDGERTFEGLKSFVQKNIK